MEWEDHAKKAEELMARALSYQHASKQPDAAGSAIRKGWSKQAKALMAEADVHANLAVAKRPADGVWEGEKDERVRAWHRVAAHPFFASCYEEEQPLIESMIAKLDRQNQETLRCDHGCDVSAGPTALCIADGHKEAR